MGSALRIQKETKVKISELIEQLEKLKKEHGDIPVKTQSLSHVWSPDITVRGKDKDKWVLLNS